MVLTMESWLLIIFSTLTLLCIVIFLKWRTYYPVYIIFFLVTGLTATWVSHILVLGGYMEFPWRLFKDFTLNNIVYDLYLFPGFLLLMIRLAIATRKVLLAATDRKSVV